MTDRQSTGRERARRTLEASAELLRRSRELLNVLEQKLLIALRQLDEDELAGDAGPEPSADEPDGERDKT